MKHYMYIAVIFALLAFVKWYSDRQYDAGYTAAGLECEVKLREANEKGEAERTHSQAAINALTTLWLDKSPEKEVIYEEITKYVPDDNYCNLTRGAVRLFNESADPLKLQTSFHPTLTDETATERSTIGQREIIGACTRLGGNYYKTATQLVTLQKVVRELDCVVN